MGVATFPAGARLLGGRSRQEARTEDASTRKAALPDLDPLVHAPLRLAVLALLSALDEGDFTHLRDRTGSTDGNLSGHLSKLEEGGYVAVTKGDAGRRPRTTYRLTEKGRAAFLAYVRSLKTVVGGKG